ncbi:MAG TPA: hypothetical protein VFS43_01515 [Polyangiaceae bacterium]|nr:hypothetical protein [Polyangiaceae bacterium]
MAPRAWTAGSACVLGLSACGGAPPREASGSVVAIDAPVAEAPGVGGRAGARHPAVSGAAVDLLAPGIGLPREIGCSFRTAYWKDIALHLRFRAGGPSYAEALGQCGNVEASLPVGGAERGATLDLQVDGVRLRGVVDAGEVKLYPARPIVVGGVFVPSGSLPLRWKATAPGSITWALGEVPALRLAEGAQTVTSRCGELGAEPAYFEPSDAPGFKGVRALRDATLRRGIKVPVAETPGGPPRATIELGADDPDDVSVVGVRGGQARVLWWSGGGDEGERRGLVLGWVPGASLKPSVGNWGIVGGMPGGIAGVSLHWTGCAEEAPLFAEVEGERRAVGRVLAGTRVARSAEGDEGGELVPVSIVGTKYRSSPDAVLRPAPGARLLMRRADVERCGA